MDKTYARLVHEPQLDFYYSIIPPASWTADDRIPEVLDYAPDSSPAQVSRGTIADNSDIRS